MLQKSKIKIAMQHFTRKKKKHPFLQRDAAKKLAKTAMQCFTSKENTNIPLSIQM